MTSIEWTEATWNPIVGCSVTSPGCTNCYAMRQAARIERMAPGRAQYRGLTQPSTAGPVWTGKVAMASDEALTAPLRRRRPTMYFVNSMGDLFHPAVPDDWIDRVFAVMALARQHTFQVRTKQSRRMRAYLSDADATDRIGKAQATFAADLTTYERLDKDGLWPLLNVWLGVSVEDQKRADERIPDLLDTPAAIRFVSAEPLLGPVDFGRVRGKGNPPFTTYYDAMEGARHDGEYHYIDDPRSTTRLDWVIVGGESGPNARPMHPDWARSLRDQCAAVGVPFFFKQHGEFREFDTGTAETILVDNGTETADAIYASAINPSFVTLAGRHILSREDLPFDENAGARLVERVGKRRAGRLLDGIEHNAMPEVRP